MFADKHSGGFCAQRTEIVLLETSTNQFGKNVPPASAMQNKMSRHCHPNREPRTSCMSSSRSWRWCPPRAAALSQSLWQARSNIHPCNEPELKNRLLSQLPTPRRERVAKLMLNMHDLQLLTSWARGKPHFGSKAARPPGFRNSDLGDLPNTDW